MPHTPQPQPTHDQIDIIWRSLHIFNLYRLTLAGLLCIIYFSGSGFSAIGTYQQNIFTYASLTYLLITFISGFASRLRHPAFKPQVLSAIFIDIAFITLMSHASGGTHSGLGSLMVISVAACGLLLGGRMAYVFAATATITLFSELIFSHVTYNYFQPGGYTKTGLLGASLFGIALISHILTRRISQSEALAKQRGEELEDLTRLNELIVQKIEIGIIAVDSKGTIRLLNDTAQSLLNLDAAQGNLLKSACPALQTQLEKWHSSVSSSILPIRPKADSNELQLHFTSLALQSEIITVISIEDSAQLTQQAQQARLASLGRLTASIAHEIRNPLSAINHAGELLQESEHLQNTDRRMTEIIHNQGQRINAIIENILSLSRKKDFKQIELDLTQWLMDFIPTLIEERGLPDNAIHLTTCGRPIYTLIDPSHLLQIMHNLCENGIHHSIKSNAATLLNINCSCNLDEHEIYIDILDFGSGVPDSAREQVFEPFYTTEAAGTGLGLYISRELCELNHGLLQCMKNTNNGAHLRINLKTQNMTSNAPQ